MKHDGLYMSLAHTVSEMSHCKRKKVGALIVKDGNIMSFGWNGTPPGFENRCEDGDVTKLEVIHAEQNALSKAAASTVSTVGATMFVTVSPCEYCAKSIIQSGIKRVVYQEEYRDSWALQFLVKAGVSVELFKGMA